MTQPVDKVEPPLASTPVQITCGVLVTIALVASIVSRWASTPSPRGRDSAIAIEVDLNRADALELSLLPGVGPVLANRITANRDRLGPFHSVADLDRVYGVGSKTLAELEKFAIVSQADHGPFQVRAEQQANKSR